MCDMSEFAVHPAYILIRRALRLLAGPALVLCALLSISGSTAHRSAPHSYTIVDLGTLGGLTSVALDINNLGHVCGSADVPTGDRHAFFWKDGVMTDCGLIPGPTQTEAWGINNHDQVVGIASNSGDTAKAFIWQNGQISEIPPTNVSKDAFAINDSGQIVGDFYAPGGNKHAYIWQNSVLTDLGTLGGTTSLAWDINSIGDACGQSFLTNPGQHPVLWRQSGPSDLGGFSGGGGAALGLNNAGQVVGASNSRAFLWQSRQMIDFTVGVCGAGGSAKAVNNLGQIIGTCSSVGPFLYDPLDGIVSLSDRLPPNSGWASLDLKNINDAGQIVGAGTFNGFRRAFLMTPAPEIPTISPHSGLLIAILVIGFAVFLLSRGERRAPGT